MGHIPKGPFYKKTEMLKRTKSTTLLQILSETCLISKMFLRVSSIQTTTIKVYLKWVYPFTLRVTLESVVCYSHTFENNFAIERKFSKYLKESCCLASDQHFSFKCFPENAFVSEIFPKLSGLVWPLKNESYMGKKESFVNILVSKVQESCGEKDQFICNFYYDNFLGFKIPTNKSRQYRETSIRR